ncbi:TPA: tetratricopeptide repeat protein [Burkholderia cenocepacia]|uniref:tetratricopeptide repeat protein n=1 Tax=Burkholderia cenocepacia TaxID=95486 RepID=UPI0009B2436B|nr:tetratricopeptide repeat protein [Burkholderia cenocepacia]MCW3693206.1 tetratricopeptide repeat protein [Burkholderia cenocepacia]QUN38865.1 tetratricopeptide repeat protein [Burkholderia cenocepacia]QUO29234.1 tetratricopeptide repeat protein [Burkholderia cenocepacia]
MNQRRWKWMVAVTALGAACMLGRPALPADALRPDVAKPLAAAQELYRAHKYRDALGKIALAAAVPNRTPYETYMVEEMRGAAAMAAGDTGTAAQAYESVLNSGRLSGEDEQRTTAALAGIYFQQKNYPLAIRTAQRYLKAGGTDPEMRTLLMQSYYLSNDCAPVVSQLKASTDTQANGGHAPDEGQLQMLATCAQKVKDGNAYRRALGLLVAYHPSPAYWDEMIAAIRGMPGYLSSLDLDIYRLRRATGSLATADAYMEMTQLALVAGSPAEGKQVIDQGFATGVLGKDAQADREKRLQALAAKRAQPGGDAATPVTPLDTGMNLVFAGRAQQGLPMMEQAIAKGGLEHPDAARLRLGEAYYVAGQKARAVQVLRTVKGTDGSGDLARLWTAVASR